MNFLDYLKQPEIQKLKKRNRKIKAFEYFVYCLIKWWSKENPDKEFEENDLSMLKVLMLLFFTSAVGANRDSDNGLLDIFEFHAMPFGHIEKDIAEEINKRNGQFSFFKITNRIILTDYPDF